VGRGGGLIDIQQKGVKRITFLHLSQRLILTSRAFIELLAQCVK
jgi:hypothetical protein